MFSWIARVLPSLGPAFTAFLNPWVLVGVLVYGGGMMFYGIHLESGRFEAFKVAAAAAGEAQHQRALQKARDDKSLKEATDNANKTDHDALVAANATLNAKLHLNTGSGFVSARQQPVGSPSPDGQLCFDAGEFDNAIRVGLAGSQRFAEATAGLAEQGAAISIDLTTARKWTAEQRARAQEKR